MADTPAVTVTKIRKSLIAVEEIYPDSIAVKRLHKRLEQGLADHGHLLGFSPDESAALAGGGTPKLPPPPGN
jgi:hypothetical protein